ncbi:MAG: HEAT repeat domain-containing protein [Thermodesulfobacteriota bacterium]|nr:HEAT repeat domain-containing protein [Thermodesulfobacteriota bacterium]
MSSSNDNMASGPGAFHPGEEDALVDINRLSEAVIELNIARKNVSMYPPGHVQVEKSVARAYAILNELVSVWPRITIGVAKDTLLIGEEQLDSKNPVFTDFAVALNGREIAAVTFVLGLRQQEVAKFEQILSIDPEKIMAHGGIEKVLSKAKIENIIVQALDYSGFHLTEEEEITLSESREESSEASMWQDFVSQLVSDTLDPSGDGLSPGDSLDIPPAELAKFLNESKVDPETAAQSYESIVAQYIRRVTERKQLTEEQSATLATLINVIQNLKPDLRKQFLAAAFQCLASDNLSSIAEDLLQGFPDDMVIEMIRQANEEGREIPRALLNVVQRMSFTQEEDEYDQGAVSVKEEDTAEVGTAEERPLEEGRRHDVSQEEMEKLFEVKTNKGKGESECEDTLEALAKPVGPEEMRLAEAFPIEEYMETLADGHIALQLGQALLVFMEADIDDEHYKALLEKLLVLLPDLLEHGAFSFLLEISDTLRRHGDEKSPDDLDALAERPVSSERAKRHNQKGDGVRKMALDALRTFNDPDFVSKAVSALDTWADEKGQEAADFLMALGPSSLPLVIDLYGEEESPRRSKVLFRLLVNFGEAAATEAQERLDDTRSPFVRNLLVLIRHVGTQEAVDHVRPLVKHEDREVQMEALAILLKHKDPGSIPLLREALLSKDNDISSRAVSLAGQHGGDDVAEDLASMLKTRPFLRSGYELNEKIIHALGEIGNRCAVPILEKLARSRWVLYPNTLSHMKVVLFDSLERYPEGSLQKLLSIGQKLDDPRIRRACIRMAEAHRLNRLPSSIDE